MNHGCTRPAGLPAGVGQRGTREFVRDRVEAAGVVEQLAQCLAPCHALDAAEQCGLRVVEAEVGGRAPGEVRDGDAGRGGGVGAGCGMAATHADLPGGTLASVVARRLIA